MRILTRKIYRAYKELDKFDDDVCKRYVKRARRLHNVWKGCVLIIIGIPISVVLWLLISWATTIFHLGLQDAHGWYASDGVADTFMIVGITGVVWFPAIVSLIIRDRWLHRCLRKQLSGVQCPACGYSLIGLSVLDKDGRASVHCPECGSATLLHDMGLTRADIDPAIIQESV